MKTVVVANQKGGVGKTAIATHLAFHLRDHGGRVLVLDVDNQGNCSRTLRTYESGVKASQLFGADPVKIPSREGITLASADISLAELEGKPPEVIQHFVKNMRSIGDDFDWCVIDTPPTVGRRMLAALIASDYALCPIELEAYAIDGLTQMIQTIIGVKQRYNEDLEFLGMLPNRFNGNSPAQKANLDELLKKYAHLMIAARIGNRSSISEALAIGVPVWELKKTAARDAAQEMGGAFDLIRHKMGGTQ